MHEDHSRSRPPYVLIGILAILIASDLTFIVAMGSSILSL